VPELSYKDLEIQDGTAAQRTWMHTVLDGKNQEQKDQILANLKQYCRLDTLAMIQIWRVLNGAKLL
jgi:anthranilate phosphoribosyltransferase